jgi:MFS family permease
MLAAFYSIPGSLFRIYGGKLSDRYGARAVMYWTFGVSVICTFMLSYPPTTYIIEGIAGPIQFSTSMGLVPFVILIFVLGFFMSLGKAAVFKHIPVYYPNHIGAVGGLVGMIGGLGGFVLPLAFGVLLDLTGVWTSSFALLFLLVSVALVWMHVAIGRMERAGRAGRGEAMPELPEMQGLGEPGRRGAAARGADRGLAAGGRDVLAGEGPAGGAAEPLDLDLLPAALLRGLDGVVGRRRAAAGDRVRLHDEPALLAGGAAGPVGGDARIFYAFLVPIFGGRLWTTVSTASLLLPAFGIGYAVQNPETPFLIFLVLALLCGLGGGNFASSMGNISFFFPKREKGNALADQRRPRQSRRQRHAVPRAVRDHLRPLRRARRAGAGRGRRRADLDAERRLRVGAADPDRDGGGLVGDERHPERQGILRRSGGDLPAGAHLADVLALHRHVRDLHRHVSGVPAAVAAGLPGGERAQLRLHGAARGGCLARGHRLDLGQVRRGAGHLLGVRGADRGHPRHDLVPADGQLCRLLRDGAGALLRERGRQRLDLPDGAGDHAPRGRPGGAAACPPSGGGCRPSASRPR